MSYCVNCGVELEKGAKRCPLCAAPVINPFEDGNISRAYPEKVVLPPKVRRRYAALLLSFVMIIPNIICPLVDHVFTQGAFRGWSLYVNIASILIWVFFVLPFLWKKAEVFITILIDTLVTCTCLYVISMKTTPGDWFFKVALPFVLMLAAELAVLILWARHRKRDWPYLSIAILILIMVCSFQFELLLSKYLTASFSFVVSSVIGLSSLMFIIFFVFVSKNKRLRAWLSRKFFI